MAWTAPKTWTTGEVVTAAIMNSAVKNNLRYLKGLDGAVTLSDGLDLGTNELTINSLEIVGVDGEVNKAVVEDHTHADGANCGTIDHEALTGRGDDDHTQYALRTILTTRGDIIYRNATVWTRLAKGTEGQVLTMGANDPGWSTAPATLTVAETEVFNGTSPTNWTDLDLSSTIGAQPTLVLLKINIAQTDTFYAVRKNGDTDEFYLTGAQPRGVALAIGGVYHGALLVATDNAGIIEWKAFAARAATIDVIAYIK